MHQDWKIECWEEDYVYTHIWVARRQFRNFELHHCQYLVQVAFWAQVAPDVVEVHPLLYTSSMSADCLLCHFGKHGSPLIDFHEPLPGVFLMQPSPFYINETHLPTSSHLRVGCEGVLNMNCASSSAACENPPLAILAIFNTRRMSDYSCCTWHPCLAIVADMLQTYKILVAASQNEIELLPLPYTTTEPSPRYMKPALSSLRDPYHDTHPRRSQIWQPDDLQLHRLCRQMLWSTMDVSQYGQQ